MNILICTVITVLTIGCSSSKNSSNSEQPQPTTTAEAVQPAGSNSSSSGTTNTNTQQQTSQSTQGSENKVAVKYRLILSFISIGEGTDSKAVEMMNANLSKWESKTAKKITFDMIPWGREGETDFCFLLNELSPSDQAALARDMRETFQSNPLVQISEYQESTHKR